jgi:Tfp pilus assembly protein PilF
MSLLIKALKQAEIRHQEALVTAAADAAAAVAVVEATAKVAAPAGIPLALEPTLPPPAAAQPSSETAGDAFAPTAPPALAPEARLFDDAHRALSEHAPIEAETSQQGAGSAVIEGAAHAAVSVAETLPEPAGRMHLFPARLEAPGAVPSDKPPAVESGATPPPAAAPGPLPDTSALPVEPKAPVGAGASKTGARRPSSRMLVGGVLALAVCGVGTWLALEVTGVPTSNRAGVSPTIGSETGPSGVAMLPPMTNPSDPVTAAPSAAAADPAKEAARDGSLQPLAPFGPAARGSSPGVVTPAAAPAASSASARTAEPAAPRRATVRRAAASSGAAAAPSRGADASPTEPIAAVVRTPVPRSAAARTPPAASAAAAPAAAVPDPVSAPASTDRASPAAGDVRFFRASAQAEQIVTLLQTGWTAAAAHRSADARRAYDEVLRLDRNNVDAWIGLATVAARDGESANAERAFRRVLEIDPSDSTARAGLVTLLGTADVIGQESHYRNLLARDNSDPALHYALGNSLAAQGRWAEAQQSFFNAVAGEAGQPDYLHNLAVSLERLRQPQAALSYYRKALAATALRPAAFDVQAIRKRIEVLEGAPPRTSAAAPAAAVAAVAAVAAPAPASRFAAAAQSDASARDIAPADVEALDAQ